MAALRAGVHTVIIPQANEKDLDEIDQSVRRALNFVVADHVDNILDIALLRSADQPLVVDETSTEDMQDINLAPQQANLGAKLCQ